jgi:predicted translin family RNA/ssDNA-binding protein
MLNKKYFQKIRKDLLDYAGTRREVIKVCGDAQHLAKKAIFARQRDDVEAEANLREAGAILAGLQKKHARDSRVFDEGAYKAAVEEFVEATLFSRYLKGEEMGEINNLNISSESFVGGLCDVPGELLRYAVKSAMVKDFKKVKKCFDAADAILSELVDMDLTGYNRQKFDQAKQACYKLEQVAYEVSLKS